MSIHLVNMASGEGCSGYSSVAYKEPQIRQPCFIFNLDFLLLVLWLLKQEMAPVGGLGGQESNVRGMSVYCQEQHQQMSFSLSEFFLSAVLMDISPVLELADK